MANHYESDFEQFIKQFLAEHPEVVEDQKRGWYIYWDRQVDPVALKEAEEDSVPFDTYEFDPLARPKPPDTRH
jgi:hypothetical protein